MKSFFSSRISKVNALMTLCALGVTTFSSPTMAAPQEACVKTSTGEIVCGQLVSKPVNASGIQVVEATYGGNCRVTRGNVTNQIASACNGNNSCNYTVDYTVIGDPASGCAKDYSVQWKCGGNRKTYSAFATPEAGYQKIVQLVCP
ncbi:hypothetical protein [Chamaesiphon polymorphus]|uniref:hypothetical protein n=1 Tax=Chamaesiphon polymorphus TaxID=2107691 RepID=UPI0011B2841D|nr:hypothetical protein [Chamaesiphon polymorphus]